MQINIYIPKSSVITICGENGTNDFYTIDELSVNLEITSNGNKYSYCLMEISYSSLKALQIVQLQMLTQQHHDIANTMSLQLVDIGVAICSK